MRTIQPINLRPRSSLRAAATRVPFGGVRRASIGGVRPASIGGVCRSWSGARPARSPQEGALAPGAAGRHRERPSCRGARPWPCWVPHTAGTRPTELLALGWTPPTPRQREEKLPTDKLRDRMIHSKHFQSDGRNLRGAGCPWGAGRRRVSPPEPSLAGMGQTCPEIPGKHRHGDKTRV